MKDIMFKQLEKYGFGGIAFGLMAMLVWNISAQQSVMLRDLSMHMTSFTAGVIKDHQEFTEEAIEMRSQITKQHDKMIDKQNGMLVQQKEMIVQQRQITDALGRINGYTH